MTRNIFVNAMIAKFVIAIVALILSVAVASAQSYNGGRPPASGGCGPTVSFNGSHSANSNHSEDGSLDSGNLFGVREHDDAKNGFMVGFSLTWTLDGGRACDTLAAQNAEIADRNARANRAAVLQENQALNSTIETTIKLVQFCSTADLEIPAVATLCKEYVR